MPTTRCELRFKRCPPGHVAPVAPRCLPTAFNYSTCLDCTDSTVALKHAGHTLLSHSRLRTRNDAGGTILSAHVEHMLHPPLCAPSGTWARSRGAAGTPWTQRLCAALRRRPLRIAGSPSSPSARLDPMLAGFRDPAREAGVNSRGTESACAGSNALETLHRALCRHSGIPAAMLPARERHVRHRARTVGAVRVPALVASLLRRSVLRARARHFRLGCSLFRGPPPFSVP